MGNLTINPIFYFSGVFHCPKYYAVFLDKFFGVFISAAFSISVFILSLPGTLPTCSFFIFISSIVIDPVFLLNFCFPGGIYSIT